MTPQERFAADMMEVRCGELIREREVLLKENARLRAVITEHQAWIDANPSQWVTRKDSTLAPQPDGEL